MMAPVRVSRATSRRVLWLVALFTVPVPYYLGGFEIAPVARLLFLTAIIQAVVATEGAAGYQGTFALLSGAQSVLWLLALYGGAALLAFCVHRFAHEAARAAVVALLAAALLVASLFEIYQTPMSSHSAHSNLAGLFD